MASDSRVRVVNSDKFVICFVSVGRTRKVGQDDTCISVSHPPGLHFAVNGKSGAAEGLFVLDRDRD